MLMRASAVICRVAVIVVFVIMVVAVLFCAHTESIIHKV